MFARAFAKAHKIANDHAARLKAARGRERGIFAAKKDTRGELFIYEQIGESFWGGGVSAKSVIDQLEKLKGVSQLDIRINSEGGDVFDGKAIYNALRRFAANKTVYIDGLAASAATFIAMAGDRIVTAENATWMIHEASGLAMGNAGTLRDLADVLDGENAAIAGIYAARTGQPASMYWTRADPVRRERKSRSDRTDGRRNVDERARSARREVHRRDREERRRLPVRWRRADLAAQIPALRIAAETQRRIAAAKKPALVLAEMEQSLLHDRRRASPGRTQSQRPAART
jgi:ATP-dependent protease ClpP protease subunit